MTRFLMATHGTDGDVLPFTRIGRALRDRGHEVVLLSHAHYERKADEAGLEFVCVDTVSEFERNLADTGDLVDAREAHELRWFFDRNDLFDQLRSECQALISRDKPGDSVLVGRCTSDMAVLVAAEATGSPRVSLALSPLQHLALAGGAAATFEEMSAGGVDAVRAEFGLGPVGDWTRWMGTADLQIGLWPRWFDLAGFPSPYGWRLTGFAFPDEDEAPGLPDEVAELLAGPVPPVLVSGGTGRMLHAEFYRVAVEACRRLGRPALLVVRHRDLVPDPLPEQMTWVPRLPFRDVMPRCAAVVHHGGMGTLARALAAGTPQVILAHGVDRPDNAQRLARRGVAAWLPAEEWQADRVVELLSAALAGGFAAPPGSVDPAASLTSTVDAIERMLDRLGRTVPAAK
jgi:UDP:flavonoid glycosyltransferase YjiC (YdhE family)